MLSLSYLVLLLIVKPTTHLPTVPGDSGELIQLLENTVLPNSSCFLVTAEVASLYPNVDTKKAVVALDLLHRDARVPETPLLIQLTRIVLDNNYLSSESVQSGHFSSRVLYCFGHSFRRHKDIVEQYTQFLVLYWRFIHDIFVIWCGPRDTLLEFPRQKGSH